jgi:hypothetical protein
MPSLTTVKHTMTHNISVTSDEHESSSGGGLLSADFGPQDLQQLRGYLVQ